MNEGWGQWRPLAAPLRAEQLVLDNEARVLVVTFDATSSIGIPFNWLRHGRNGMAADMPPAIVVRAEPIGADNIRVVFDDAHAEEWTWAQLRDADQEYSWWLGNW